MKYDVIVVGAGPAGATAATVLAEQGKKVLLIDKEKFPRDKPCGGGLPTRVLQQFPFIQKFIDASSYGSITYSSSLQYKLSIIRKKPMLFMIRRTVFDEGLVKRAEKKGVHLAFEKKVIDLCIYEDKAQVVLDTGEIFEADLILGCDGTQSIVAEKSGLRSSPEPRCVCIVQEQPLERKQITKFFTQKRIVHIFIKVKGIAGYGWVFPKKNSVNIGVGEFQSAVGAEADKRNLKQVYEEFVELLKKETIIPADFSIENIRGGILPVFPLQKTYTHRVLLCGDAAGFINAITGEGIYYAMKSGVLAAETSIKACTLHDFSEKTLSNYQKLWKAAFGKDLELFGRFNNQWGKSSDHFIKLLSLDKTLAKLVIGATGGQLSFSQYKYIIFLRYLYVRMKSYLIWGKKEKKEGLFFP
ncbi:MAG: geranylgeranyl reductase family protein [Candidatus Thermoplasmatota archaeon]